MATVAIGSPTESNQALLEETMRKYSIDQATLNYWEQSLGLTIPTDDQGRRCYSQQHINLFKNIKKYLALGRTLADIRSLIALPPDEQSTIMPESTTSQSAKPFGSSPVGGLRPEGVASQEPTVQLSGTLSDDSPILSPGTPQAQTTQAQSVINAKTSLTRLTPEVQTNGGFAPGNATTSTFSRSIQAQAEQSRLVATNPNGSNSQALQLVEKLIEEKDALNRRLVEAEKLNSHLYNVNNLFHRKVKELSALVTKLKANNQEKVNMKLMDDKSRLHRQLLEAERQRLDQQRELDGCYKNINQIQKDLGVAQQQLQTSRQSVDPADFVGVWQEQAELREIVYDQFGINVEPVRTREYQIAAIPSLLVGDSAILRQQYGYENNALWQRQETLTLALQNKSLLVGELQIDYWLDGAPVCQALYQVRLIRSEG